MKPVHKQEFTHVWGTHIAHFAMDANGNIWIAKTSEPSNGESGSVTWTLEYKNKGYDYVEKKKEEPAKTA